MKWFRISDAFDLMTLLSCSCLIIIYIQVGRQHGGSILAYYEVCSESIQPHNTKYRDIY